MMREYPGIRAIAGLLATKVSIISSGRQPLRIAEWTCTDIPAEPGETPVGGVFLKQTCEKATPERHLSVTAHFLRKSGQRDIDPVTGEYTEGQFESWTRFELMDPGYAPPKKE